MRLYRETEIRNKSDESTRKMLDKWHELCRKSFDSEIEVVVGDRHECKQLASFPGELNTAMPMTIEGKVVLALLVNNISDVKFVILSHEIGHWVLKMMGFRGIVNSAQRNSNIEIGLNSFTHHIPLYSLQKKLGHNPQNEIDSRASSDMEIFTRDKESEDEELIKNNALLIADDLFSCSESIKKQLAAIVEEKHPQTWEFVRIISETASYYDLLKTFKNERFQIMLVRKMRLGTAWTHLDEVTSLKKLVAKTML